LFRLALQTQNDDRDWSAVIVLEQLLFCQGDCLLQRQQTRREALSQKEE